MKNITIRKSLVFCAIFIISSVNAFAAEQGSVNRKEYILSKLLPLAELMTSEKPSLKDAERLLGGSIEKNKRGDVAYIHGHGYTFSAHLTNPNNDQLIFWCDIRIHRQVMDISFREIVPILGKWEEVRISKTSLVKFSYSNPNTGNRLVIFAHMYFPPKDPGSPIINIRFMPQSLFEKKR